MLRLAHWVWLVVLTLPSLAVAGESADPAELRKAEAAATEAKVFFKAGLYEKASAKFMEAFAISHRPSLMYNAARAYEEGLNYREAVALLKHYKELPDVGEDGRRDASERIARMESALAGQANDEAARRAEALRQEQRKAELLRQQMERDRLERERLARLAQDPTATTSPATPPTRRISWPLVAASGGAFAVAGAMYGLALWEAGQGSDIAPTSLDNVNAADGHFAEARLFRGFSIGFLVAGAGLAAWTLADWQLGPQEPEKKVVIQARAGVLPVAGGGMLAISGKF